MPRKVSATVIQTFILLSYKIIYGNTGRGKRNSVWVVHSKVGSLFRFVVVQSLYAVMYYSDMSL